MHKIKSINEKVINKIIKKRKKQNTELFNLLDDYFNKHQEGKVGFCLIYLDPTKDETIPVVTNFKEKYLYMMFKHFLTEMEKKGENINDKK